jgi:hypothetical protein
MSNAKKMPDSLESDILSILAIISLPSRLSLHLKSVFHHLYDKSH